MCPMAMDRVASSLRGAERRRREQYPQLPAAPDGYPIFPDTSSWPVVFPDLPAALEGCWGGPAADPGRPVAPACGHRDGR
jgi:trans,polycis-decaprenyl diphosphate synthase